MRAAVIALGLAILTAPAGAGPRSIVGDWAADINDCGTSFVFHVGPRELGSEGFSCTFSDVSRTGTTVQFVGTCNNGPGPKPETVTATEADGRLALSFARGKGRYAGLRRCPVSR